MPDGIDPKLARIERHFRRVFEHLDPAELTRGEEWPSHDQEEEELAGEEHEDRFLDYYSPEGLRLALDRYGFFEKLRAKGLGKPLISLHKAHSCHRIGTYREHGTPWPSLVVPRG